MKSDRIPEYMAGGFHYMFVHESEHRPYRYPEKIIDFCCDLLDNEEINWWFCKTWTFIDIDIVYSLTRASRQTPHRFWEIRERLEKYAEKYLEFMRFEARIKEGETEIPPFESLELRNVSFQLHRGEILGFSGLMGAGRTETARAIYGADAYDSGEIYINGEKVHIKTPEQAVKYGICYLSEDRKRYGLLLDKSVAENSVLSSLDDYITAGWINDVAIEKDAKIENAKMRTKTPSVRQKTKNLSGGNQQKVIIARWLLKNSDIFIFDEPTRGIDVGAKSEIYSLMEDLASQGKAIIMISSELAEVQRLSDRVVVMCEGRVTATLDIQEASQETIMKYATMREE